MLDAKRLRHAMLEADCTVRELAKVCGISPSAFYKRLSGAISFRLSEVNRATERLHLTPEQRNQIFFAEEVS